MIRFCNHAESRTLNKKGDVATERGRVEKKNVLKRAQQEIQCGLMKSLNPHTVKASEIDPVVCIYLQQYTVSSTACTFSF